jgi:hypothetical protein
MSSTVSPALASTFLAAGTGAFSISVGQSPTLAVAMIRARGFSPFLRAYSGEASRIAAAPSTTPELLPAWCMWSIFMSG